MLSFGYSSDNQHDKGGNYVEQNLFRAGHRRRHYEVGAFLARCRRYDLRGGFRVQAVFHCDQSGISYWIPDCAQRYLDHDQRVYEGREAHGVVLLRFSADGCRSIAAV